MHLPTFPLAAILPAPTDFLTMGRMVGGDITLTVGALYSTGFLIAGPLLILAAAALVAVMYGRVKFYAMEYGFGRTKAILPYIALGLLLASGGAVLGVIGWANQGYSVILNAAGLTERSREGLHTFRWETLKATSERVNSTDFWLEFHEGARVCRVSFQQRYLGETVQDRAIEIAQTAISAMPPLN